MTYQSTTIEFLTTPVEGTSTATGTDAIVTWSYSAGFYVECAVVVIGVAGAIANALILYAMVASKQHKKHVLIFNQNALDLYSCVFLVITYIAKLSNIHLSGSTGYWLCVVLLSENLLWTGIIGSIINLASVTVERYLKVVHAMWSKKNLRKWMIYSAAAFSWFCGTAYNIATNFTTSAVIDGVCYGGVNWDSEVVQLVHGIWNFLSFYVIIILLFIFCYWRILRLLFSQLAGLQVTIFHLDLVSVAYVVCAISAGYIKSAQILNLPVSDVLNLVLDRTSWNAVAAAFGIR